METNLVVEGLKFMTLGMGTVFVFLAIMIVMMNIMSSLLHRFFPEPKPNLDAVNKPADNSATNKKVIAAITAAITHHRKG